MQAFLDWMHVRWILMHPSSHKIPAINYSISNPRKFSHRRLLCMSTISHLVHCVDGRATLQTHHLHVCLLLHKQLTSTVCLGERIGFFGWFRAPPVFYKRLRVAGSRDDADAGWRASDEGRALALWRCRVHHVMPNNMFLSDPSISCDVDGIRKRGGRMESRQQDTEPATRLGCARAYVRLIHMHCAYECIMPTLLYSSYTHRIRETIIFLPPTNMIS